MDTKMKKRLKELKVAGVKICNLINCNKNQEKLILESAKDYVLNTKTPHNPYIIKKAIMRGVRILAHTRIQRYLKETSEIIEKFDLNA